MNAIIIDDDITFCNNFQKTVIRYAQRSGLPLRVDIASSAKEILYTGKKYDIFFIDIEMPDISGFDVIQELHQLQVSAEFIFVSAYDSYMQRAFFKKPSAFIRKTHLSDDLKDTIQYLKMIEHQRASTVFLSNATKSIEVSPATILYCQSEEHYVSLYFAKDNPLLIRTKLDVVGSELSCYDFIRIHNRYLVNLNHVAEFNHTCVHLKNGASIPVSRSFQKRVKITMLNWFAKKAATHDTDTD